jgi:hypothetical protein
VVLAVEVLITELVGLELQIKDLSEVKAALTMQAIQMVVVVVELAVLVFDQGQQAHKMAMVA